jgi:hypothetical protein
MFGFLDRMFFSGLGGYAKMTPEQQEEKRTLFELATPKTQRRWWKQYMILSDPAAHAAAMRAISARKGHRRTAEEKMLGL